MKRGLVVFALGGLWLALSGFAINSQGTAGAPKAVSTAAVKVIPCSGATAGATVRNAIEICNQGSQTANTVGTNMMFCEPGPAPPTCGAATTTPTAAGAGKIIFAGTCFDFTQSNVAGSALPVTAVQSEWDCICATTDGCNAYTVESP